MSKVEHDAEAAKYRADCVSRLDKPWYRSSSEILAKNNIENSYCLDLCCGNGEFSRILRDQYRMQVVCADYIPFHLDRVAEMGFETFAVDIDADARQVDATAQKYAGSFDLVVSLAAIEHVFDSDNLLRFAHTVLKPGGILLVNTPNISFLSYRLYSIFSGNRPAGEGHHIRFWDYRFLRTNLYLNGFSIIDDGRKFYALPQDAMLRAFRNRRKLASLAAWFFHACRILQHVPFLRGLCCDELTVLARKDDAPAIGFELNRVKKFLRIAEQNGTLPDALKRLKEAHTRGWLNEHLYLSELVDSLNGQ